jgi:putative ABC transport system permease protein
MKLKFWLRWAGRDLRQRWLQVIAIALIIALGTGMFSGFGGMESWRIASMDMSYGMLNMYDLRLSLTPGSRLPQDEAIQALSQVAGVKVVEPRLLLDTQVDVLGSDPEILVVGQIMGVETRAGGPHVNQVYIEEGGQGLTETDSNQAVLEYKFARHYDLEPGTRLLLSAGLEVEVVGLGQMPEYFMVIPAGEFAFFMGEAYYAVVVLPLATVQSHYQQDGQINDVLFLLEDGVDQDAVQTAIEQTMAERFPDAGITINTKEEDPIHFLLYSDAEEDQVMMNFFSIIVLAGAALAAFNLAGRIVESQRRQIGISMALGVPRLWIALRPLLMGLQIAFVGTLLGLGLGLFFSWWIADLTMELARLPHWEGTLLHWPSYLSAGLLGIFLPLLATMIPVWQAVRTPPLDAIHGHLIARSSGLNRWLKGVRLPGNTFSQMPLKNSLRSVRRSGLMTLGIATAVILLTLFLGLVDTMDATLNQAGDALLYRSPERLVVTLTSFYPTDHPQVENIASLTDDDGSPLFAEVERGLQLAGRLRAEGVETDEAIGTTLEYYDPHSPIWKPNLLAGELSDSSDQAGNQDKPTLIISQKMADDLGLEVGDTALLEHPKREGLVDVKLVESRVTIIGIHDNTVRGFSYLDRTQEAFTGLEIATNVLAVVPSADIELSQVRRILFAQPGIASVQTMAEVIEVFDEALELLSSILLIIQGVVIFMAFLIAYNATTINVDDRLREIATMFAFGLKPRTVLWVQMGENFLLGMVGTGIGVALGYPILQQFMAVRMESMLENIGLVVSVAPLTMVVIVLVTAGVVALTPLVNYRRLLRIDIPNTLRVME